MLDKYDVNKLKKARRLVLEVYEYNYIGYNKKIERKLNTIVCKLNNIINDNEREEQ